MRVVNGELLATRLEIASKDTTDTDPLAYYARQLLKRKIDGSTEIEHVCDLLRKRTVSLSEVHGFSAVSTVHQAKGFEYDHVAVHEDLLSPGENECERNISFVSFTRHRKSLTILVDLATWVPSQTRATQGRAAQRSSMNFAEPSHGTSLPLSRNHFSPFAFDLSQDGSDVTDG